MEINRKNIDINIIEKKMKTYPFLTPCNVTRHKTLGNFPPTLIV